VTRRRICFVAPSAYPILARDRSIAFAGGAEVQQTFLAREFVRRGHEVSMVCMDFGQPDGVVIDGVTVHRMHAPQAGLPVVRFLHPRLTSMWSAMRRANADIYYQRAAGAATGFVMAFARRHGRIGVFAGASDMDFDPALPHVGLARDRMLYRWGVQQATYVVAQSGHQRQECQRVFARDAAVINSCYGHQGEPAAYDGPVLWVGSVKPLKQPDVFIRLAERCPQLRFKLIGGGDEPYRSDVARLAAAQPNVEVVGFVPFADVERHFDGASMLVNTSTAEGFPNTFLQAWSRGMPTVSFFRSPAALDGRTVGACVPSLEAMAAHVMALKADAAAWQADGARCRRYFRQHHDVAQAGNAYEDLFASATASALDAPCTS
jgi:glycosyltransferase involved in cell wall biosynthesis